MGRGLSGIDSDGMSVLLRYFDSINRTTRWILFFPVGIGASLIFVALINAGFNAYWGNPRVAPGLGEESTLAFFAALTRTLFPAIISPRPWVVGIMIFTLDLLLRAGPYAYQLITYDYMRYRSAEMLPAIVTYAVSAWQVD